jgi:hypothetical protein
MNEWLSALFLAIKSMFEFGSKVTPPDQIRLDNHDIKKPRLTAQEKTKIYDIAYRRLKNHTEIDIATDVKFNYDNLHEDDQKELTELLTARITEYRKRHPIIFRKWLSLQKQ